MQTAFFTETSFSMQDIRTALKYGSLAALALALLGTYSLLPVHFSGNARHAASVASPFLYTFNSKGTLNEASSMENSSSPYWWVNSGGRLVIDDGFGTTMQGDALLLDRWRVAYALSNPIDTDLGLHPQNIFRMVSRSMWGDVRVEGEFKILRDNWSKSPNRNASNGLLLMSRYEDGDTLYYAGLRVDGNAVIKKKYNGTYYTLAQKKIYAGEYVSGGKVNVLPHNKWIQLRSETTTNTDESVSVRLYQKQSDGSWKKILEARDSGEFGDTPPITKEGYFGVRTDFMDVSLDSLKAEAIPL
jgi:hypothetical protein